MRIKIGKKKNNTTIYFQERGLSKEKTKSIWMRLDTQRLEELCKATGTCLISWYDGLAAEIKKTKDGYTVWCGEEEK